MAIHPWFGGTIVGGTIAIVPYIALIMGGRAVRNARGASCIGAPLVRYRAAR